MAASYDQHKNEDINFLTTEELGMNSCKPEKLILIQDNCQSRNQYLAKSHRVH